MRTVVNISDLPLTGNTIGDKILVTSEEVSFTWTETNWIKSSSFSTKDVELSILSSTVVPYSGASSNVDLNGKNLTNINELFTINNIIDEGSGKVAIYSSLIVNSGLSNTFPDGALLSSPYWINASITISDIAFAVCGNSMTPANYAFQVGNGQLYPYSFFVGTLNNLLDDGLGNMTVYTKLTVGTNVSSGSPLNVKNLPTSSSGLSLGDIWNNSGVLNIVS